jgi:hypothetical protein
MERGKKMVAKDEGKGDLTTETRRHGGGTTKRHENTKTAERGTETTEGNEGDEERIS